MSVHVVIPARMASTRLPDKPLADIAGVPMIVRVAQRASAAQADNVVVAVDDQRVLEVVEQAGFSALLTKAEHPSGSDRVMEVANTMGWSDDDVVINVQGDEPLLPPSIIDQLAEAMLKNENLEMATLSEPITRAEDFLNPNIVKVVCDDQANALYFSRAPIPFPRDTLATLTSQLADSALQELAAQRHVGVYAFRVHALRQFVQLLDAKLEHIEKLEQLRWLQAGRQLQVLPSAEPIPGGVDTPEDLARVTDLIRAAEQ